MVGCGAIAAGKGIVDSSNKVVRNKINGMPDAPSFMAAPKGGLYSTSPIAVIVICSRENGNMKSI
jgi:hypothetical protein